MTKLISKEKLYDELKNRKGLIPFNIDTENQILTWIDLENYHPYEGFFTKSVEMFAGLKAAKSGLFIVETKLDVLKDENILTENIYPNAFIFHASRCGSTLLAKNFTRSRKNLVLSECPAHNQILLALTKNGRTNISANKANMKIYRNLILSTTQKRLDSHQICIIKYTSYNIFFYEFIRSIFPDIPAIFLYREPSEIIASNKKGQVNWINDPNQKIRQLRTNIPEEEYKSLDADSYLDRITSRLFSAALKADDGKLALFNFKNLKADNFQSILDIFNLEFKEKEVELMKSQFNYYSKSEHKLVNFSGKDLQKKSVDEKTYLEKVSPELRDLYTKLCEKDFLDKPKT